MATVNAVVLGVLTMGCCQRFVARFLGALCRGMVCDHTGLAMDLDRPEDPPMVERRLAEHTAPRQAR
jgi:hypothetical protein